MILLSITTTINRCGAVPSVRERLRSIAGGFKHKPAFPGLMADLFHRSYPDRQILPDGIGCVLLRPGFVKTDMTGHRGMEVEVSGWGAHRATVEADLERPDEVLAAR